MQLENIYVRSPWFLRYLIVNMESCRIQRSRYSRAFWTMLEKVESRKRCSESEISSYRDARLSLFIKHSVETVPYYRRKFLELGIDPNSIRTLQDLGSLPILSKKDVQEHIQEMKSEAIPRRNCISAHTSGTTGAGLQFGSTKEAVNELWAVWWRSHRRHGIEPRTWCGYFGGRPIVPSKVDHPPYWVYAQPGRQILFSGHHIGSKTVKAYVSELNRSQPPWLHGYPSTLALLGSLILDSGLTLGYQPRWVTLSSETLLPHQVEIIRKAFGVRPIQDYGLTEAVACASECELGNLHVDEDFAAVEFLYDRDREGYRIIGTNFTNLATPLLRYDTGDLASLAEGKCNCGNPGRVIARIDGRQEDYVVLANFMYVGRMDHVFKDISGVREAQINQNIPGKIEIRIVTGKEYSATEEKAIYMELEKRFGNLLEVNLRYVDSLPRSKNGKLRLVVSDIPDAKLKMPE